MNNPIKPEVFNPLATRGTEPREIEIVADTFEARRDAIDVVATMRARTIRVALFGQLLYRPDPAGNTDPREREKYLEIMIEQVEAMFMVCDFLKGKGNFERFPESVCQWMAEQASQMREKTAIIETMSDLSASLLAVAKVDGPEFRKALNDHLRFGRDGFSDTVTEFCNQLWASLDEARTAETDKATQASKAIGDILTRLGYIGKHVRLVSLNASVEAARAGEAGRGLAVIATEFKTLAEEIQSLANRASDQIGKM